MAPLDPHAAQLLALMQAGDMLALDGLARTYGTRLLAVARRQCHLPADAEDAVQQALLAASTSMTGIRGDGSPLAWLSALVARTCSRLNRAAPGAQQPHDDVPCDCDDPLVIAERKELAGTLSEALMSLPRTDRLLFLLAAEGFNSVEIAAQFELSHDAVRSRLKRARKQLRAAFAANDTLVDSGRTPPANPAAGASTHDDRRDEQRPTPHHR
ncbi:MAG: RNA polymerase sigma factor [Archangium sp.]|nr:RNA polymerase sigma factor [Archangium sp.]